jgi:hypothetical protein
MGERSGPEGFELPLRGRIGRIESLRVIRASTQRHAPLYDAPQTGEIASECPFSASALPICCSLR